MTASEMIRELLKHPPETVMAVWNGGRLVPASGLVERKVKINNGEIACFRSPELQGKNTDTVLELR